MKGCGDFADFEIRVRTDAGSTDIDGRVFQILDLAAFLADKVVVRLAVNFKKHYVRVVFYAGNQFERFELGKVSVYRCQADFRVDFFDAFVNFRSVNMPSVVLQDFKNRVALRTVSWFFCHIF